MSGDGIERLTEKTEQKEAGASGHVVALIRSCSEQGKKVNTSSTPGPGLSRSTPGPVLNSGSQSTPGPVLSSGSWPTPGPVLSKESRSTSHGSCSISLFDFFICGLTDDAYLTGCQATATWRKKSQDKKM